VNQKAGTFVGKTIHMKQFLFLSAFALLLTSCQRDPFPLELSRFAVTWSDLDQSGTQSLDDKLNFDIQVSITAPDSDDQFITQWEFAYFVNGVFGGVLLGDNHANANSISAELEIIPRFLGSPTSEPIQAGDVVSFRLWAIDNYGTQLEQFHTISLQP